MQLRLLAILIATFVAGLVAYLAFSGTTTSQIPLVFLILAGVGVLLIVFIMMAVLRSKHQSTPGGPGTAQALATELGYDYVRTPDKSIRTRFSHLPEIKNYAGHKHVLSGDLDGRQLTFFNHTYIIPAGQVIIPVTHCVYACQAPNWPTLSVKPRSPWSRFFKRTSGIVLENSAFNAAFKVTCTDEAFAVTLLSPEMQEFMLEKQSGMTWRIGTNMVCMVYTGTLKLPRVPQSLDRMRRFWSLIPDELEAW